MKNHSPGFLALVNDGLTRVREVTVAEALAAAARGEALIDVREDNEFAAARVAGAEHLGKGVIERDIEKRHPDKGAPLHLYCGGGYRSVLAADSLLRMGYLNVTSVAGGFAAFRDAGAPLETGAG